MNAIPKALNLSYAFLASVYVLAYYIANRLIFSVLALPTWLLRATRLHILADHFPWQILFIAMPISAFLAIWIPHNNSISLGLELSLNFTWLVLVTLIVTAYGTANVHQDTDSTSEELRAPQRWYASAMAKPIDSIWIPRLIASSLIMLPAVFALVWPSSPTIHAIYLFLICEMSCNSLHEGLDHTDIHNRLFNTRHLKMGPRKIILSLSGFYLRFVLNIFMLRVPHFYRVQHVYIHHVENNGLADTQSTLWFDRTSFFGFARHSLTIGLSWSFGIDVFCYLIRKRNWREVRLLALGLAIWFGLLSMIALHNPWAAAILFLYRFLSGVGIAIGNYFWHGFADLEHPQEVSRNSINLVATTSDHGEMADLHARHHAKSGEHFSKQLKGRWAQPHSIEIDFDTSPNFMLKAMLMGRFDLMAKSVVAIGGIKNPIQIEQILRMRVRGINSFSDKTSYARADKFLGDLFTKYVMP